MDKLGVVIDPEKTKTSSSTPRCPGCGKEIQKNDIWCPTCGTKPFEKRPEPTEKK